MQDFLADNAVALTEEPVQEEAEAKADEEQEAQVEESKPQEEPVAEQEE
ncbi:MAG: hypothetical protein WBK18_03150 [Thermacetogeniaceae bacterium]